MNISRGKVVKESALIDSLANSEIAGAVLDVFEEEPLDVNSKLWSMNNVILTPHNSFVGDENRKRLIDLIIRNLIVNKL